MIRRYDYIPDEFNFIKVGSEEDLFLGVELEVDRSSYTDHRENHAENIMRKLGEEKVYCVNDGSINFGFEMVTHPSTFEAHKTFKYKKVFDYLVKNGYKSHDTRSCGMHVHMNRTFFGKRKLVQELNLSKMLFLMEKYWDYITLIARRGSSQYATRKTIREDESALDIYAKYKGGEGDGNTSKYNAVNVRHPETFEIRIFKGTLNYNTFINTLEFCYKLARLVKSVDILDIQDITWEDITDNFSESLLEYIDERQKKKEEREARKSQSSSNSDTVYGSATYRDVVHSGDEYVYSPSYTYHYDFANDEVINHRLDDNCDKPLTVDLGSYDQIVAGGRGNGSLFADTDIDWSTISVNDDYEIVLNADEESRLEVANRNLGHNISIDEPNEGAVDVLERVERASNRARRASEALTETLARASRDLRWPSANSS